MILLSTSNPVRQAPKSSGEGICVKLVILDSVNDEGKKMAEYFSSSAPSPWLRANSLTRRSTLKSRQDPTGEPGTATLARAQGRVRRSTCAVSGQSLAGRVEGLEANADQSKISRSSCWYDRNTDDQKTVGLQARSSSSTWSSLLPIWLILLICYPV